ncbi:hypothetical protein B9T31_12900 [Acinetobacter sp. ANC 4558]|uniref:YfcC family protein n=1 Tax=Acinetobacter sp. ANC 4558 TaxID=1977876 RepID=UPI000A34A50B|nr:Na+/H+ antiporter NhaC family protein [Acinetobacter sp. ANC 4558]OTG85365.1 hypothetical protein B9T31_12900 [Acinetobacter sp. ANC 4558]
MSDLDVSHNTKHTLAQKSEFSPYFLLFIILIVAAILTWIIPAGEFDYITKDGIKFAVKNSLHMVPQVGTQPLDIFSAITQGMIKAAPIIFLILFTGGVLAVIEATGAIETALNTLSQSTHLSDTRIIIIFAAIFSILGTTGVVVNAIIAFIPIGLLVARSMGLPPILGASLVYLTCAAGFNVAILNPATTGLTQHLAQLPLFSGMLLRGFTCFFFVLVVVIFLIFSVRRARRQGHIRPQHREKVENISKITWRHKIILTMVALALLIFLTGAVQYRWGINEMSSMFIILAIIVGLIGQLSGSNIANIFLQGCSKLVKGAFIVGMASAISIVLEHGKILDPIVGAMSELLVAVPPTIASIGMFISAALLHFGISSGSGESALLIPIFSPLGDNLGLTRQVMVQSVLLGEGIVNCINPTSGVLMAVLATANIPFGQWVRFISPVIAIWFVISIIMLIIGVAIHWGPF